MTVLYTSTGSGSLGGTAGAAGLVQKAFDKNLDFQLRAAVAVTDIADVQPVTLTNPGSTVILQTYVDLTTDVSGATLTETVDPDSVSLATPTSVGLTLVEYGRSTIATQALNLFSLKGVNMDIANIVGQDLINTIDAVAMAKLITGTNVLYAGATATSTATVTAAATITSANIRKIVAVMESNLAPYRKDNLYWGGIHPRVAHDLRAETGSLGWLLPNQYGSDQSKIWNGELGTYEGVFFVKNSRMHNATDGASSARNYRTLFAGKRALASMFPLKPQIVIGDTVDRLKRLSPIGWKAVGGFAIYLQDSLYRLESGSSIAS